MRVTVLIMGSEIARAVRRLKTEQFDSESFVSLM